jgi:hypothetical protein
LTRYETNAWGDLATFAALTGDMDGWTSLVGAASALSKQYSAIQMEPLKNSGSGRLDTNVELSGLSKRASGGRQDVLSPFYSGSIPVVPASTRPSPARFQQQSRLLNQSIRLESALDEKQFQSEQPLDYDFVSPFALAAAAASSIALQPSPFDQVVAPRGGSLKGARSAAQERARAVSLQLLDIAATLSADASAALRTGSVLVVPVVPASVFMHSIAAKPSFEGAQNSNRRDYTYILVTIVLLMGLVGGSIAEYYWRPPGS